MAPKSGCNTPKRMVVTEPKRMGSLSVSKYSTLEPLLAMNNRREEHKAGKTSVSAAQSFRARPMPKFKGFEAKKSHQPCVIPEGFNLLTEQRGYLKDVKVRKHLQEIQEAAVVAKPFKATPIPDYEKLRNKGLNPNVQSYMPPRTVEFKFQTDARSKIPPKSASKENIERSRLNDNHFKALPMPNFTKQPFKPKTGMEPLTEVDDVNLNTETRASKRFDFEAYLKKREQSRDEAKVRFEEQKKKEQEEVAELRKHLVFRSKPYKYSSVAENASQ